MLCQLMCLTQAVCDSLYIKCTYMYIYKSLFLLFFSKLCKALHLHEAQQGMTGTISHATDCSIVNKLSLLLFTH